MKRRIVCLALIFLLVCTLVSGCAPSKRIEKDKISIVCTIFPAYDWVREIIKGYEDTFEVSLLSNGDVHSYQPSAADIAKIHSCDLFVTVGGISDIWAENLQGSENIPVMRLMDAIDESELLFADGHHIGGEHEHESSEYDEHIWLSLRLAERLVGALGEKVADLDRENAVKYRTNVDFYCEKLRALDRKFEKAAESSADKTVVVADRFPFVYFAEDYGLRCETAFSGCSSDTEASFETVVKLSECVEKLNKDAIIVLENSNQSIAESVLALLSGRTIDVFVMNSCQSLGRDFEKYSYIKIMEDNLNALLRGLS